MHEIFFRFYRFFYETKFRISPKIIIMHESQRIIAVNPLPLFLPPSPYFPLPLFLPSPCFFRYRQEHGYAFPPCFCPRPFISTLPPFISTHFISPPGPSISTPLLLFLPPPLVFTLRSRISISPISSILLHA